MSTETNQPTCAHAFSGVHTVAARRARQHVVVGIVVGAVLMGGCMDQGMTAPRNTSPLKPSLSVSGPTLTDLGTLGGNFSEANGINAAGQVVGGSLTSALHGHAFLWERGKGMQDLGTLGGDFSVAEAINDRAEIVGVSSTSMGLEHAFIWIRGQAMKDLGTLGGPSSESNGINDAGAVVGWSLTGSGLTHAFFWQHGHQ